MTVSKNDIIDELHKPARRNYPRRSTITLGIDDLWQADLVEMDSGNLKGIFKINRGYIRCTTLLPPFFSEIRGFIVKNWLYIYDSKYKEHYLPLKPSIGKRRQQSCTLNKYLLTIIDTFSKFAWAIPVKNKTGESVSKAMSICFKNLSQGFDLNSQHKPPKNLQTDNGEELYNKDFKKLMKQNKINHLL